MKPPFNKLPALPMNSYPHMLDAETRIWSTFLSVSPYPEALVAYDIHVGTEPDLPPDTDPAIVVMAIALFTKRLDAALLLPTMTLICEVKPYASSSAIGQALSYCLLFARDYPTYPTPAPAIVTDKAHPDTAFLCAQLNIALFQIGEI